MGINMTPSSTSSTSSTTKQSLTAASHLVVWLGLSAVLSGCANLHDVPNRWCDPETVDVPVGLQPIAEPAAVPEPVIPPTAARYKIRLEADALFQFSGARLSDMKPSGKEALNALAAQLHKDYIRVDQVLVVGHTDRLGAAQYNQRLSEQRAQTVKHYLQSQGITAPIEARGVGKNEPLSTQCKGLKSSPALIQCLQPDRRVEVEVLGVNKTTAKP